MKFTKADAVRFLRRWRVTIVWLATLVFLVLATTVFPELSWWALYLEVAVAATIWVSFFVWTAHQERDRSNALRAERDEARETVNSLLEAIHQHQLATIRDRDCGPDAYQRAYDLADEARRIRFPDIYGHRTQPAQVDITALEDLEAADGGPS